MECDKRGFKQNTPDYPDYFKLDGCVIADNITIANQFNTYFSSIGTKLASQIPANKGKYLKIIYTHL